MIAKTDYDGLEIFSKGQGEVPDNEPAKYVYTLLSSEDVSKVINVNKADLLKYIPELGCMFGYDQKNPNQHLDLWNHTLLALTNSINDFEIRMALLLHDISKPSCAVVKRKVNHYPNHNQKSAEMAREILSRLGWAGKVLENVCAIIEMHNKKITAEDVDKDINLCKKVMMVQICNSIAHNPDNNADEFTSLRDTLMLIKTAENQK